MVVLDKELTLMLTLHAKNQAWWIHARHLLTFCDLSAVVHATPTEDDSNLLGSRCATKPPKGGTKADHLLWGKGNDKTTRDTDEMKFGRDEV